MGLLRLLSGTLCQVLFKASDEALDFWSGGTVAI